MHADEYRHAVIDFAVRAVAKHRRDAPPHSRRLSTSIVSP
jgi:hypothetical protein